MRGMFTCGVMDVLLDHGIRFDGGAGISAGAAFGCNYKSGQAGRPIRYNKKYCADPRYHSLRSLLRTGDLYNADFCYRALPDELDVFDRKAFAENPMAFYAGATNVRTGQIEYHRCVDGGQEDMEWLRASASMPLVSRPVAIGGELYLDGGIADAVPYRYMEGLGCTRNVIILTQPKGYRKQKARGMPLMRLLLRKYPALADALAERHLMYNRQMDELDEREDRCVVIRPPVALGISHVERDAAQLERVYQLGRAEALRRMGDIERCLGG